MQKVTTSTGTTKYTLHGKNIVHMTGGSNTLHFFYDGQNKPAVVLFNGIAYAYLYNLQGDVIALVDANDSKVVECKYDAWGKPLSKADTLATTLGTLAAPLGIAGISLMRRPQSTTSAVDSTILPLGALSLLMQQMSLQRPLNR